MIRGALSSRAVDHVLVIPSGLPAKKDADRVTLSPYRFYMTAAALASEPDCSVLDIEFRKDTPSYTVQTLITLRESGRVSSEDELFLLYGSDILFEFESWYLPESIVRLSNLLLAYRPGILEEATRQKAQDLESKFGISIAFFPIDGILLSSREIRTTKDFSSLTEPVRRFIEKNALYPEENPLDSISDDTIRKVYEILPILSGEISPKRLLHSLNTALLAVSYAVRYGIDADRAMLAGVLHDAAKELPLETQKELASLASDPSDDFPAAILHAPAGEVYARERYGITDPEILAAIRYHTTGRPEMSALEKIIYLADKLEPARDYGDLAELRRIAFIDLNEAVIACLTAVRESFARKSRSFHSESTLTLKTLQQKKKQRESNRRIMKENTMEIQETAEKIASILKDKKAVDVEIIPVAAKTTLADFFVIASGTSVTHIKSLADEVEFVLKNECGIVPDHVEGLSTGRWVLIDYKDIVVHVFHPEEREHYSLEKLWLTKRPESAVLTDAEVE